MKKKGIFGSTIFLIILLILGAYFWQKDKNLTAKDVSAQDNAFGFLVGGGREPLESMKDAGAGWARPHPGKFVWGQMQEESDEEIEFDETDEQVYTMSEDGLYSLITLWPYAVWDQKNQPNPTACTVDDEFTYSLGSSRCNPVHWDKYEQWVSAVVERYDGDGRDDAPDLILPVTAWEVNNEPDLTGGPSGDGLRFYRSGPQGYRELLKRTAKAIRAADPNARVVIAGAAGGGDNFLNFYREVFADPETHSAFDIANIHCISNDSWDSLNVEPYQALLKNFGLTQPIWVTEAETFVSDDPQINATQLNASTKKALELGAEKIFYTTFSFAIKPGPNPNPPRQNQLNTRPDPTFVNLDNEEIYQRIFAQNTGL